MDPTKESSIDAGEVSQKEAEAGILPSHGISLDVPAITENGRPPMIHHLSTPAYHSPLRHHRRTASQHREVKETLNARSEYTNSQDDGTSQHHINQYIIKEEIGRGSFGAVHLAVDQYGQEYAVKEFSKSRLRKRAQSNILRRPHHQRRAGHLAAGMGLNAPLHRHSASDVHKDEEQGNPLYLIKEEIAIMKKLNHPNLVSLIEVLDDPEEDSLYMVLEMCKKGVIMKVGLDDRADPYDIESCRCWFRDLILGIEYLHAQGVVHRDIKPDNLLLTKDDVLKIVDFGVSEMFEKTSEMITAKSAGSPAFLPPELCVAKHGDISGKAADIWSMGVSLYCLRFGKIPFERHGVLELYEAIKRDKPDLPEDDGPEFRDILKRLLEKDPKKRIRMEDLRKHPWVTKNGKDPLLSKEENVEALVEPPTEIEMNHAITSNFKNLMVVMKAVNKFKSLAWEKRPDLMSKMLGRESRYVSPPDTMDGSFDPSSLIRNLGPPNPPLNKARSVDIEDRRKVEAALASEGVTRDIDTGELSTAARPVLDRTESDATIKGKTPGEPSGTATPEKLSRVQSPGEKGHAHDPMDEEPLFLGIGPGEHFAHHEISASPTTESHIEDLAPPDTETIAESPTAAEFNIYDTAYREEVERIRAAQGQRATVYLTRRVDNKAEFKNDNNMLGGPSTAKISGTAHEGFRGLVDAARARDRSQEGKEGDAKPVTSSRGESLIGLVNNTREGAGLLRDNAGLKAKAAHQGMRNSVEMGMDRRGMPRTKEGWRSVSDDFRKGVGERKDEAKEKGSSAFSSVIQKVWHGRKGSKEDTDKVERERQEGRDAAQ